MIIVPKRTDAEKKMQDQEETLKNAKALLEYAKTLGMSEVPLESVPKPRSKQPTAIRATSGFSEEDQKNLKTAKTLDQIQNLIGDCSRCKLCKKRTKVVFGTGNPSAEIMFVGEAPGRDEDEQGEPFVGRAGQLLTKIIQAMGYERKDVYIANICKCRPPDNRPPEPDEVKSCIQFLIRQAELIAPKIIVCLGSTAVQNLLSTDAKITGLRGNLKTWQGIPVMPTYHPAFLLRNPNMKKPVWEDMQAVLKFLGKPLP